MLNINNLHVTVEGREILRGINLHVKPGEVHAIMGPNGSGKSTLAGVIAGREGYDVSHGKYPVPKKRPVRARPGRTGLFGFVFSVSVSGRNSRRE